MTKNLEHQSDVGVQAARALSKKLFGGARYRIEIGAAIARTSPVNTVELAETLGIVRQSVHQELHMLEQIGMLARVPPGSDRKVYFLRQDSSYWAWCEEALGSAESLLKRGPRY